MLSTLLVDLPRTFRPLGLFHAPGLRFYEPMVSALLAVTAWDETTGYVQSHSYLAAVVCAALPHAEPVDVFRVLAVVCHNPMALALLRVDGVAITERSAVLDFLLQVCLPELNEHLRQLGCFSSMFFFAWTQALFARVLALPDALSVWDGILLFGSPYIFVTAVAILRLLERDLLAGSFERCLTVLTANIATMGPAHEPWLRCTGARLKREIAAIRVPEEVMIGIASLDGDLDPCPVSALDPATARVFHVTTLADAALPSRARGASRATGAPSGPDGRPARRSLTGQSPARAHAAAGGGGGGDGGRRSAGARGEGTPRSSPQRGNRGGEDLGTHLLDQLLR